MEIQLNNENINEVDECKPKNKKKLWKIIIIFILILALLVVCIWKFSEFEERLGIKISPMEIFKSHPELKKDTTETYTNMLIVGIDTREENPGLQNTDTIMLLSYNHKTQDAVMISLPRDFFVLVPNQGWYTKINGIYSVSENSNPGQGLKTLKQVVEDITNTEIQYYGMVDISAFSELIDLLGGITVDVENPFTDYNYPVEGAEYLSQTISFSSGPQAMNSVDALRFVRSRHSFDYGEGSDFARARRQQRVIMGIKDKILSSETLLNPVKVFEILKLLEKNIEHSPITNTDIQAVTRILKEKDISRYTFVLDPSLANYTLLTDQGLTYDAYAVGPIAGLENYTDLHKYLKSAFKSPHIYSVNPSIVIYDIGLGENNLMKYKDRLPYINITLGGTLMYDKEGAYIFKNNLEDDIDLTEELSSILQIPNREKPEFVKNNTFYGDYIILLGKDNISYD